MWVFTARYGFISAVAARDKATGKLNGEIMLRGRDRTHLESLKAAFPELAAFPVIETPDADYAVRVIVPEKTWVRVATKLAREVAGYTNFKSETLRLQGPCLYERLLHSVWGVMRRLQTEGKQRAGEGDTFWRDSEDEA
ncbi:MAG TPA: hypothetical protein VGP72_00450 [Planctomycetota bacterium]|jgi:hypothetical protein